MKKIYKTHIHQKNRIEPVEVIITDRRDGMMEKIRCERKFYIKVADEIYNVFADIWRGDEK